MELAELAAYAEEKYRMREEHKWAEFPGFSALTDPDTGKWVALLMRQWDFDAGMEIQRCDIKCGREALSGRMPGLSAPFRMKGEKWVGVKIEEVDSPEAVFRLLDRAVAAGRQQGATIVLNQAPVQQKVVYGDTALPRRERRPMMDEAVPEKIRQMLALYQYQDGSFEGKCRNFYQQGKFMEDYTDDEPWTGDIQRYFPTYHDLNIRQLRGYFTWRAGVRRGEFTPAAASMAYLYLYELLNGIGVCSPEEALEKMRAFETGFLDAGFGDTAMRGNLRRWMLDYGVLHNIPAEQLRPLIDPIVLQKDEALAVLRDPEGQDDEAVFSALCGMSGKKLEQSPMVKRNEQQGKHLFAAVWRTALQMGTEDGRDFFTACFGEPKAFPWYPLANAVYWAEEPHPETDYRLDNCRTYRCRGGVWREQRYDGLYFDRQRLQTLLREADRLLRKELKTGHYLREMPGDGWAAVYVEAAIQAERQAAIKAARLKITLDLSSLDRIRQDAQVTRDSLLTEEEMEQEKVPAAPPMPSEPEPVTESIAGLDPVHTRILLALLNGGPIEKELKENHLMLSVVADTINGALFDEIGDNVLEEDGDTLAVVEDYREEILQLFGR